MDAWLQAIVEWANCLDITSTPFESFRELREAKFFEKLIDLLSRRNQDNAPDEQKSIARFVREEYPDFTKDKEDDVEEAHLASLLLLRASLDPAFHRPMCANLRQVTQIRIKLFLEKVLRHGQSITREDVDRAIAELAEALPDTPRSTPRMTPKTRPLRDFFDSPVARSSQARRLVDERVREIRRLKSELETERFEKADLQEDLRIQSEKIQNLHERLRAKSEEMKALRDEWTKPATPQSCSKYRGASGMEERYKDEIRDLEVYAARLRAEIDALEGERDELSGKLASFERQTAALKEMLAHKERSFDALAIEVEEKDRELRELELYNDEMRARLQEASRTAAVAREQSFEVEGNVLVAQSFSALRSANSAETLSSVIDIQLQEAREESSALRNQLASLNRRMESVIEECEDVKRANNDLRDKVRALESTRRELDETREQLASISRKTANLESEKIALASESRSLESSLVSTEERLRKAEANRDSLASNAEELRAKLGDAEKRLSAEKVESADLKSELRRAESKIAESSSQVLKLAEINDRYESTVKLFKSNLKDSVARGCLLVAEGNNVQIDLEVLTDEELVQRLETLLKSTELILTAKDSKIETLNATVEEMHGVIFGLRRDIGNLEGKEKRYVQRSSEMIDTIEKADIQIRELESAISRYSEEVDTLTVIAAQNKTREKEINELQEDLRTKSETMLSMTALIEELTNCKSSLISDLEAVKRSSARELEERKQRNDQVARELNERYEALQDKLKESLREEKRLGEVITGKEDDLEAFEKANARLEEQFRENKREMEKLEVNVSVLRADLNDSLQKIAKLEEEKLASEERHGMVVAEMREEVDARNSRAMELSLELESATGECSSLRKELADNTEQIELLAKRNEDLIEERKELERELSEAQEARKQFEAEAALRHETLTKSLNDVREDARIKEANLEYLAARVNELERSEASLANDLNSARLLVEELEKQRERNDRTAREMSEKYDKLEERFNELENEGKRLAGIVTSNEGDLEKLREAKACLEEQLQVSVSLRNDLEVKICELEAELNRSLHNADKLEGEKSKLREECEMAIVERDKNVRALSSKLESAQREAANLSEELITARERVDVLTKSLNESREELSVKNVSVESLSKCVTELEAREACLKNDLKFVESSLEEQRKRSDRVVREMSEDYVKLEGKLNEAKHEEERLENIMTRRAKELKSIEEAKTSLEEQSRVNAETKRNLEARISSLEADLERSLLDARKFKDEKTKLREEHVNVIVEMKRNAEVQNIKETELSSDLERTKSERDFLRKELTDATERLNSQKGENERLLTEKENLLRETRRLIDEHSQIELKTQSHVDTLESRSIEAEDARRRLLAELSSKEETLQLLRSKLDLLTKEKLESELKMKEVIVNLQEVKISQNAVLETQGKALDEKCSLLGELQKRLDQANSLLSRKHEDEKSLRLELEAVYQDLKDSDDRRTRESEELRQSLASVMSDLETARENYEILLKNGNAEKSRIARIRENLNVSRNDLMRVVTAADANKYSLTDHEDFANYLQSLNEEMNITREAFSRLRDTSASLVKALDDSKRIDEENSKLKCKVEAARERSAEYRRALIRNEESPRGLISKALMSRDRTSEELCNAWQSLTRVLRGVQNFPFDDDSMCEVLKDLQTKKERLEGMLAELSVRQTHTLDLLMSATSQGFSWIETKLRDIRLEEESSETNLEFSNEESTFNLAVEESEAIRKVVASIQREIEELSISVESYEVSSKSERTKRDATLEVKLQKQIASAEEQLAKERKEFKSKLELSRVRNAKLEKSIDELRKEIKRLNTESSSYGMKEEREESELASERLKVEKLEEENRRLKEANDELQRRPKSEDFDVRLKEVHKEYDAKLETIKQKMKNAYTEQVAKVNQKQDEAMREKVEALRAKMEQQCRKHADEMSKYKAHTSKLSTELWTVSEKLLGEKKEKEDALDKLRQLYARLHCERRECDQRKIASNALRSVSSLDKKESSANPAAPSYSACGIEMIEEEEVKTYARRRSVKSIQVMGNAFKAEDEEGEIFDNVYLGDMKEGHLSPTVDMDRLSVLKMRNSLCKPHLKSSYPAETHFHPSVLSEEDIKSGGITEDVFNDSLSQSLLPGQKAKKKDRTQTSYKKPGPPTPSKNGGRLSLQGNELRSPHSRILKERNNDRRASATPRRFKNLFASTLPRDQDENITGTPKGRRISSIFRKQR